MIVFNYRFDKINYKEIVCVETGYFNVFTFAGFPLNQFTKMK